MSTTNGSDGNDDLLEQVEAALDALDLNKGATRDALMDGVKEALEQLGVDLGLDMDVTDDAKPHLRVVGDDTEDTEVDVDVKVKKPEVRVRVVKPVSAQAEPFDGRLGRIAVAEGAWQTLYRGTTPQTYRIGASTGVLDVALDGELVERLVPGVTLDVQACVIRVRAPDGEGDATGGYARV